MRIIPPIERGETGKDSNMIIRGSNFEIRAVKPRDEESILRVYQQCEDFLALGPVPTASMDMVLADLALSKKEHGIFCGIFRVDDGAMLGIVDFVPSGWEGESHAAFLSLLMIASPYRSHGLGAEVVRLVEHEMLRSGEVTIIRSGVQVNNPAAIGFWQRMGYQIVSDAEPMEDGTVVYRLEKPVMGHPARSFLGDAALTDEQNVR